MGIRNKIKNIIHKIEIGICLLFLIIILYPLLEVIESIMDDEKTMDSST